MTVGLPLRQPIFNRRLMRIFFQCLVVSLRTSIASRRSLHQFDVRQQPRLIEITVSWAVQAKISEPAFTRNSGDPVLLETDRRLRSEVNVCTSIVVLSQIHLRRTVGDFLFVLDEAARVVVVGGDRPEQLCRNDRWYAQPVGVCAV